MKIVFYDDDGKFIKELPCDAVVAFIGKTLEVKEGLQGVDITSSIAGSDIGMMNALLIHALLGGIRKLALELMKEKPVTREFTLQDYTERSSN